MKENNVSLPDDDLGTLRKKVEALPETDFKRKLLGGVDEEDVVKYVNSVRERLERSQEVLMARIEEVTNSKKEVQEELENYKDKFKEAVLMTTKLNAAVKQLEEEKTILLREVQDLKSSVSEYKSQIESKDDFCCELETRYNTVLIQLKDKEQELKTAADSRIDLVEKERDILEIKLASLEEQLSASKKQLSEQMELYAQAELEQVAKKEDSDLEVTISGIRNEIEVLCRQFEKLQEMVKENEGIKNQLKQERIRADKAEKDLKEFRKMLSDLESKINPKAMLHTLRIG